MSNYVRTKFRSQGARLGIHRALRDGEEELESMEKYHKYSSNHLVENEVAVQALSVIVPCQSEKIESGKTVKRPSSTNARIGAGSIVVNGGNEQVSAACRMAKQVKIIFSSEDKRRWRLNPQIGFTNLLDLLDSAGQNPAKFNLTYEDEEGDTIRVTDDAELEEAFNVASAMPKSLLVLRVKEMQVFKSGFS